MTTTASDNGINARIAKRLARDIGDRKYNLWFDQSARLEYHQDDRTLRVAVPSSFAANGIKRQFEKHLRHAATEELGQDVALDLEIDPDRFDQPAQARARSTSTVGSAEAGPAGRTRFRGSGKQAPSRKDPAFRHRKLDDFVVGPCNELAHAAARRITQEDASHAHPLFIHGGCGLGKTHLLQGICAAMLERAKAEGRTPRVRYTTGEQFTNEYITAIRSNKLDAFRRSIRMLDLLAVDDVHFLATREKTQQEFLHCFDRIELGGARVALASDNHPRLIKQFSEALVSRCVRGLVVQVQPPCAETKLKLVNTLAQRRGLVLGPTVAEAIVERLDGMEGSVGSVREIEGLLTKLHALSSLPAGGGKPSAKGVVGHALLHRLFDHDAVPPRRKPVRFDAVLATVTAELAVTPSQVMGRSRHRQIVLARSLVIYLTRELTSMSYPEIARAMGRNNHSTVITACQRMKRQIEVNEPMLLQGQPTQVTPKVLSDRLRREVLKAGG